jgi:hypothetical protein
MDRAVGRAIAGAPSTASSARWRRRPGVDAHVEEHEAARAQGEVLAATPLVLGG